MRRHKAALISGTLNPMTDPNYGELKKNYRNEVFGVLKLISSEEEQLEYQKEVPIADVSAELFCLWDSCYQLPLNQDWYQEIFSENEFEILKKFDMTFESICKKTSTDLTYITEFIKTKEWAELALAAKIALKSLNGI